ncbi:hypothetical protein CPC08DRAFT_474657 [Agrocybe pediades]|nr:hypothetical protein CPC08DRAFT_474657 [Agrocybe pediades]
MFSCVMNASLVGFVAATERGLEVPYQMKGLPRPTFRYLVSQIVQEREGLRSSPAGCIVQYLPLRSKEHQACRSRVNQPQHNGVSKFSDCRRDSCRAAGHTRDRDEKKTRQPVGKRTVLNIGKIDRTSEHIAGALC